MSSIPRTRRSLKPRSRSTYENKLHGGRESYLPSDDHCINTSLCRVQIVRAKTKDGPLVFRPWPALDYENPSRVAPGRNSVDPLDHSDWMVKVPVVKYAGLDENDCQKATFILYRPDDPDGRSEDPYRKLFYGSKSAHDAGSFGPGRVWDSQWNKLLSGGKGRGAALSSPTALWVTQGEVYANGEKTYFADRGVPLGADPSDDLVVIQLNKTAGDGIMKLFDRQFDSWDGDENVDPSVAFVYGDPTGVPDDERGTCGPGWFFTVFDPKKDKGYDTNTSWNGEIAEFQGHEVALSEAFTAKIDRKSVTFEPELSGQRLSAVLDRWQFWFDDPDDASQKGLLHIPSVEEKCLLLAKGFWRVPRLLHFAWADNPEYFTDEVKAVLNRRVAAVMPGADDEEDEGQDEPRPRGSRFDRGHQVPPASQRGTRQPARRPDPAPAPDEDDAGEAPEAPPRRQPAPQRRLDDEGEAPPPRRGSTPPWERSGPDADGEVEAEEPDDGLAADDAAEAAAEAEAETPPRRQPAPQRRLDDEDGSDDGADDEAAAARTEEMRQAMQEAGVRSAARSNRPQAPPAPPESRQARAPRNRPR